MPYANNKRADQPAHLRSLISTFVVHCLDNIIPLVSISKSASLYLVSVAEQTGLSYLVETPKTGFLMTRLILFFNVVQGVPQSQTTFNTKRKRKRTKTNTCKTNKCTRNRWTNSSSPSEVITREKGQKQTRAKQTNALETDGQTPLPQAR